MRPIVRGQPDEHTLTVMIHELGHRYWYKFMTEPNRKAWKKLYKAVRDGRAGAAMDDLVQVGKPLPFPVKGRATPPVVERIDEVWQRVHVEGGGVFSLVDVRGFVHDLAVDRVFPSRYAATTVEEFFAECFAYHALGKLSHELEADFARLGEP